MMTCASVSDTFIGMPKIGTSSVIDLVTKDSGGISTTVIGVDVCRGDLGPKGV